MADTPQTEQPDPAATRPDRFARIAAARASIARETRRAQSRLRLRRLVEALWPLWALLAAFLGAALLGLPQALPYWAHWLLLIGVAGGAVWLARVAVRGWRAPTALEAESQLDDGSPDRPVEAVRDELAAGVADPATQGVWAEHQARLAERAAAARAPALDLRVSHSDRFAIRHAALLALAAGGIAHIGQGGGSLTEALSPSVAAPAQAAGPVVSLEAWASPPAYTRRAPIYLSDRAGEDGAITLPVGSEITLRAFDAERAPTLAQDIADEAAPFAEAGPGSWAATLALGRSGSLTVSLPGADPAVWALDALSDAPPTIAFTEQPSATRGGALRFGFEAADDYGVALASAEVTLDVEAYGPRGLAAETPFPPLTLDLPLSLRGAAETVSEIVSRDLSEHPFAGLPVVVTLIAQDGAGQQARASVRTTLPERRFRVPLAKAIIEQRRELAWTMAAAPRILRVLDAIAAYPDDAFDDASAYLTMRTARRRLGYAVDEARVAAESASVAELLWQAALLVEHGDLSDAERRLREIQEELSEALENGASDDEIAQLMDELREALREFMQQLAEEALRNQAENGQQQQQQPMDPNQMLSQQDLMDMLDQLEQAMRDGMQDMARQMLENLQQMLENLQMAQPGQQGQQGQDGGPMQELQDMIGQQQGLADRSFEALRDGQQPGQQGQQGQAGEGQQPGQQPGQGQQGQSGQGSGQAQGQPGGQGGGPEMGAIARDQEALRQMLDDLRRGLPGGQDGQGPGEALERAERSMGAARDALEGGDADQALQDQVDALDALREGAQDLAQQMQQQPGQNQQAGQQGQSGDVRDEDPFGRPTATDGPMDGDTVQVPDAGAMKRARELMDEIRRRAGDQTRSPLELEYLRRLLERF